MGAILGCEKQLNVNPMDEIDPNISKIKDFEIELPYGNEFYSDSISSAKIVFHFYDETGKVLQIDQDKLGDKLSCLINGKTLKNSSNFAFKIKTSNTYKVSFGINGLQKEVNLKAVPKNGLGSKNSEFQLLFRVINDDFPQAYFENTINYLNDIYTIQNKMNLKFKLAEYDEIGNKLKRKGVQLLNDETFKADDSPKFGIIKYGADKKNALNIYLLEKDATITWSGLWNGENFQINTLIFSNKRLGDGRPNPAFTVMAHEIGHYFGLQHIYRNDNNCLVQTGVNDIEAYNNANGSQTTTLQNQGKYMSNCGKIWKRENLMDGGQPKITNDQKNMMYLSPNFK
jgi:Pregnancy-associated plasma protein-A